MKTFVLLILLIVFAQANKYSLDCDTDSDCEEYNSCEDKKCIHKGLLPLDGQEIGGTILICFLALLSNAAGIGGSSILIALLLLMFKFETHMAIPLAQVIIWSGSAMSVILKVPLRHPTRDRPLISWDLCMHLTSTLLLGTTIGVMINVMFPAWLILALLTLLVGYLSISVLKRGIRVYKKETHLKMLASEPKKIDVEFSPIEKNTVDADDGNEMEQAAPKSFITYSIDSNRSDHSRYIIVEADKADTPVINPEIQEIMNQEKGTVLFAPLCILLLIFGWVILSSFTKGDSNVKSIAGFKLCSEGYWGFFSCFIVIMILLSTMTGFYVVRKNQKLERLGYNFDEHDLRWDRAKAIKLAIVSFVAGLGAGLLGIGGGLVVGPVMLSFGVRPEISAANSSVVIIITSSNSIILYLMAGLIDLEYAIWFLCFSVAGSATGILVIKKIVEKKKRASILILILAFILFVSAILLPSYGISNVIAQDKKGELKIGFKDFCSK